MQNYKPSLTEAQIKRAVADFLEYGCNQGKWYSDRLQAGEFIEVRGKTRRRVKGCRAGTADFFVLKSGRVIFLEIKSPKGKQRPEQATFQKLIESEDAYYFIIRSVEELAEILK